MNLFIYIASNILHGVDDITRLTIFALQKSTALKVSPIRVLFRSSIPTSWHRQALNLSSLHHRYFFAELFALVWSYTAYEFINRHASVGYQVPIAIIYPSFAYVIFCHRVGSHAQRLKHHAVKVGTLSYGIVDAYGDDTTEEDSH